MSAALDAMRGRLRRALPALVGLTIFLAALEVLRRELAPAAWPSVAADVIAMPRGRLAAAVLLTALNYAALTGYDFIAFTYVGKSLARWRVAVASFLAYAIANNVGFAIVSGASVRYRFYTRWGVTGEELSRIVFAYAVTFWLGLCTLGGLTLALSPLPARIGLPGAAAAKPIGWLLVGLTVAYVAATFVRTTPIALGRLVVPLPRPRLAMVQFVVSAAEWALAGSVFAVLLPPGEAGFLTVLGAFLAAQVIALASHVPGGVGVFEGLVIALLSPYYSPVQLLAPLVVYRVVYYLLPLSIALVVLVFDELHLRRTHAARVSAYLGRMSELVTPRVLAVFAFLSGALLLFSGATPAAQGRLALLGRVLPLGVIETSHFLGSLTGAVLLLVSQGLSRRVDAAYYITFGALAFGAGASLLKGADVEEAVILGVLLILLGRARPSFNRRAALLETRFSAGWIAAVVAALAASIWLGIFAFKHVEYSDALWWQFAIDGEASRSLRASVGASAVALLFALARLLGHAPHEIVPPGEADLDAAGAAIAEQRSTFPYLVYLRDKSLVFDETRRGFVMYGVQGRTWVALGDPVGPPECIASLVRLFLERADDFGGTPVFYEARGDYLHHYADFGLTFVKLGEEARVDLSRFTLDGGAGAKRRHLLHRLDREGAAFRVAPAEEAPLLLDALEAVSNDWIAHKAAAEKGFSLGFFDRDYVSRFPIGLVERHGRIEAFANIWPGPGGEELSIDLMRYRRDAPRDVMEALLVHLLAWGRERGYRWFALGMAPMSGFERSPVAPLWTRVGRFVYEHGDTFYNFQGLRAFKEKFDPEWEARYLAYPGGLTLPRIPADVSALVAGGYGRIFKK